MKGSIETETYGLKSQKTPTPINELKELAAFKNNLIELVKNIKFRTVHSQLQRTLKSDIKLIQQSSKTLTPTDKTSNMYRITKEEYNKRRRNAITSNYKKANENIKKRINEKGKEIVKKSFGNIIDRMDINAESNCFITIKDYEENFLNRPKVRLINPAKNELGRTNKTILDNINMKLFQATKISQWKNTVSTIKWFNSLKDKHLIKFVMFGIKDFHPSINVLSKKYDKNDFGLYRDDGLAVLKNKSGPQSEQVKKNIQKIFKEQGLDIIIQCNMKVVNYLDVTFNLNDRTYKPYTKPNNEIKYIHKNSNHPPSVTRQIPLSIESRLSTLSFNEKIFQEEVPPYQKALQNSGYRHTLTYKRPENDNNSTNINKIKRNSKQQIIWFNPPLNLKMKKKKLANYSQIF